MTSDLAGPAVQDGMVRSGQRDEAGAGPQRFPGSAGRLAALRLRRRGRKHHSAAHLRALTSGGKRGARCRATSSGCTESAQPQRDRRSQDSAGVRAGRRAYRPGSRDCSIVRKPVRSGPWLRAEVGTSPEGPRHRGSVSDTADPSIGWARERMPGAGPSRRGARRSNQDRLAVAIQPDTPHHNVVGSQNRETATSTPALRSRNERASP